MISLSTIFGSRPRTPKTIAQKKLYADLKKAGFIFSGRGWPSYLCINPKTGEMMILQAKNSATRRLRRAQKFFLERLAAHGLNCQTWDPDTGFKRIGVREDKPKPVYRPLQSVRPIPPTL